MSNTEGFTRYFIISILFFATLTISACGSNRNGIATPKPIEKNSLLRQFFTTVNKYNISEKERFIKLKASHTIYIMKGGTGDDWLKRNRFTQESWQKLEDRYWLDPEVRKEVSKLTYRILNKLEK